MKKTVRKTGDYGIGIMIHSVHMTDDVPARLRDGLLAADPADCFGAVFFFTTDTLPAS